MQAEPPVTGPRRSPRSYEDGATGETGMVGWYCDARLGFTLGTWVSKCQSDFHVGEGRKAVGQEPDVGWAVR